MTDSTVLAFRQPGEIADPLTEILRQGARELLAHLRGVSSGDMAKALQALVGADVGSLSAQALGRLKSEWKADHAHWQVRDLSARSYVYLWADGIYFQGRMEDRRLPRADAAPPCLGRDRLDRPDLQMR